MVIELISNIAALISSLIGLATAIFAYKAATHKGDK